MSALYPCLLCKLMISACASHTSRWSSNDDKRIARIAGYLAVSLQYSSSLRLSHYVDASIESSSDNKSTSGFVLALKGPATFAILAWDAKRQRERSVAQPLKLSLCVAFHSSLQRSRVFAITLRCYQNNQIVLATLSRGFPAELKHPSKFDKINVASACQAFHEPGLDVEYIKSAGQRANILTKSLRHCL